MIFDPTSSSVTWIFDVSMIEIKGCFGFGNPRMECSSLIDLILIADIIINFALQSTKVLICQPKEKHKTLI
jgi:hypothetical protein